MNKKRIVNILEIIIQAITVLLLFCKGMYVGYDGSKYYSLSFSDVKIGMAKLFLIVLISLFVINIVICLGSIKRNNVDKDGVLHVIIPIVNVIIMFAMGPLFFSYHIENSQYMNVYIKRVDWLFYTNILLLFAIVVISLIKRSNTVVPKIKEQPQIINNIQQTSNADELKKFKELLDTGIITQEEFDAKKKQLLGL